MEKLKPGVESKQKQKNKNSERAPRQKIRAMGFNGEVVDGWEVMHRGRKGQWVLERADESGEKIKKTISDEDRLLWNPELTPPIVTPEAEVAPRQDVAAHVEQEANSNELIKEYGSVSRAASKEVHENNEDRVLAEPEDGLFGVFDGMGGYAGGERASELAKEAIEKKIKELPKDMDAQQTVDALRTLIDQANHAILEEQEKNPDLKEMGTTASLVKLIAEGEKNIAIIARVGDSPVYIVRKDNKDGELECVGIDNEILDISVPHEGGSVPGSDARLANIKTSEEYAALEDYEKHAFDRRNILVNEPVGSKDVRPKIYQIEVKSGDRIVIASDGITDNLTRERIAQIVGNRYLNTSESSAMLANEARATADLLKSPEYKKFKQDREEFPGRNIRAKDDDMSTIVVEVGEVEKAHEITSPAFVISPKAEQIPGENPAVESTSRPEPEPEEKEKLPTLDETRRAYVKALREYDEANKGRASSIYGIGGDNSAIAETRAAYDAALKAASKEEQEKILREKGYASGERNPNIQLEINRSIREKFIIDEGRKMAALRISEMSEQKQSWYKKAWEAYSRLPSKTKIAISTAISTGVGLAAGGGVAYLARRAASPLASASAGFLTNVGFGVYDKTIGKKNTKEYQMSAALQEITGDISECLDDVRLRHDEILQNQADREKNRMYLKIAIAAVAGASASGIVAHYYPSGGEVAHHVPVGGKSPTNHATGTQPSGGSHPAETPPVPKAPDHMPPPAVEHPAIEVHKGDSLWEITAKELEKDPGFDKLNDAQKTWLISDIVDRAEAHKAVLGIVNPDHLAIGEKIDLSSVLKDSDVHGLMEKAGHLTAQQQENILANNHAITSWLHAHPHEHLTGARAGEIIHDRVNPHAAPEASINSDGLAGPSPDFEKILSVHHPDVVLAPQHVQVGTIAEQIHRMSPNPEQGQQLIERINGIEQIPPVEMRQLLLIAAERAGDHHPIIIDINNVAEMRYRMQDYLVSYPRAQGFGFNSYDHWARVRDVSIHKFAEDTTISPRPEALQSALRHSLFHRGASVHEMRNGALRSVPLEERHAKLGMAIMGNSDLVRRAPQNMTVGQFVAQHHSAIRRV